MESIHKKRLLCDLLILILSISVAGLLVQTNFVEAIINTSGSWYIVSSFIAGLSFTSVFTTAPAMVALAGLGESFSPVIVALVGALGALIGDALIFSFVKGHLTEDISYLLSKTKARRLKHIFTGRYMRWSLALLGALVIASPLPDELGLTLMGISQMSFLRFTLISYTFNFIGILLISLLARTIV